ncbi:ATP-binding mismatch repair protein [Spiromyces aspiralis]|uniref:ATP-binding mismatch repair protein n=1 Tax=Spiromyces aspiralis TaxID=68401 RepID=A0ACC1HN48_9FUNG|nr:ATP-binding mismatch repair protein [Spiromyces aspiralis]
MDAQPQSPPPSLPLEAPSALSQLAKSDVHKLCSGQVITDLCTAVKELLENSIDANATLLIPPESWDTDTFSLLLAEIRLRDYGMTSISVIDDGDGIPPQNFEHLCMKHWTSKLRSFADLDSITTFGFRGEALSSLCAMASVTVTTNSRSVEPGDAGGNLGITLTYNRMGKLLQRKSAARGPGTTVTLTKIFEHWPVRYQELKKNVKREFAKCVAMVEQQCIIHDGIRILLVHHTPKGDKQVILQTPVGGSMLQRIISVLGNPLKSGLEEFELSTDNDKENVREGVNAATNHKFVAKGYISKPIPGAGRANAAKQYIYINSRPCDLPSVKRVVNEIYRSLNPTQYPVLVMNLLIDTKDIDVNVTPNKRSIILKYESALVSWIQESLRVVLLPASSSYTVANSVLTQHMTVMPSSKTATAGGLLVRSNNSNDNDSNRSFGETPAAAKRLRTDGDGEELALPAAKRPTKLAALPSPNCPPLRPISDSESNSANAQGSTRTAVTPSIAAGTGGTGSPRSSSSAWTAAAGHASAAAGPVTTPQPSRRLGLCRNHVSVISANWEKVSEQTARQGPCWPRRGVDTHRIPPSPSLSAANISNMDQAAAAEVLDRNIHKCDFLRMQILGQFNLGFIIVRMSDTDDLYIIDQHASDEKYNFEMLQANAKISSQPLISALSLEMSVTDESIAIENMDLLAKNGFVLKVDETKPPGRRLLLRSQPFIDNILFTSSDLMELIGKLSYHDSYCHRQSQDGAKKEIPRCSRARHVFATRACRKSIMIGDALNTSQMTRVVRNLSTLDHPWNCPHGRPTMRHLYQLPEKARTKANGGRRPLTARYTSFMSSL